MRLLVLLAPAQPKDASMTLGSALAGPEQFDIRSRQLWGAAPWITVVPYFAHNLAELLGGIPSTANGQSTPGPERHLKEN